MGRWVRELRPDKRGKPRWKWVRPQGVVPPSQEAAHRRAYVTQVRHKCLEILGARCARCGYDANKHALQIDHKYGGGSLERSTKKGGSLYLHMLKHIDSGKYQVLCANCNMIKRAENQECPRKDGRLLGQAALDLS